LGGYAHQDVPFEKLVEELNPERSLSYSPLFQVAFDMDYSRDQSQEKEISGLTMSGTGREFKAARFDITLGMMESGGQIRGSFEYSTDLFDEATIVRMIGHYQHLLQSIVADPDIQISRLPLLSEEETSQQLITWNETAVAYPHHLTLHELFEAQAAATPAAVALISETEQIGYGELNERANQLAHYLRELGVGPEQLIGVCCERSIEMMMAVLGVLKAGAAYVPLDPEYPAVRLVGMMADAGIEVLLTQSRIASAGASQLVSEQTRVVELDREWPAISERSDANPAPAATPDNLAYVIYTSGSTGRPKGVMVTHRALVNFTLGMARQLELRGSDRMLQFASLSFDVFAEEVFPVWSRGGAVVLVGSQWLAAGAEFTRLLARQGVTGCELPTAFWHEWMREMIETAEGPPEPLRFVIIGGENALRDRVKEWKEFGIPLINAYGLTEVAVTSIVYTMEPDSENETWWEFPIGRPVANTHAYILDKQLQPVPVGTVGELYIGGEGLARGYFNRPELTSEKFMPHPFSTEPGERLYRTGDLVRYLADGNIENLGRIDFQLKVRGFRVELGEIEAALDQHPAVHESVVVANGPAGGDKRLVAYVVCDESQPPSVHELKGFLKDRLPHYMVPPMFVFLDAMPLSPNGKIDRRALPDPEQTRPELQVEYVAPRTEIEGALTEIWMQLLGLEQIGIFDNFFDLGGHSLLATKVVSRVRETFEVELPLRTIFESPTIAQLSESIANEDKADEEDVEDFAEILATLERLSEAETSALLKEKLETV
jgi:amino acid adenylation domain-containing protein